MLRRFKFERSSVIPCKRPSSHSAIQKTQSLVSWRAWLWSTWSFMLRSCQRLPCSTKIDEKISKKNKVHNSFIFDLRWFDVVALPLCNSKQIHMYKSSFYFLKSIYSRTAFENYFHFLIFFVFVFDVTILLKVSANFPNWLYNFHHFCFCITKKT